MMRNDGGPAFPVGDHEALHAVAMAAVMQLPPGADRDRPYVEAKAAAARGMSLRDYFAAKAPPPPNWWIESYAGSLNDLGKYGRHIAQWNYEYADAMIAERAR